MALQPVDGGSGDVNGDFVIDIQEPDILTRPNGSVEDAVTVTARERAYNVPFQFTVPTSTWQGALFETYTRVIASYIQAIAQFPHVVAIYGAKDTDRNGFLQDYLFVTVGIDGTESEAQVRVLQDNANSPAAFAAIDAAYNTLVRNQNAGG